MLCRPCEAPLNNIRLQIFVRKMRLHHHPLNSALPLKIGHCRSLTCVKTQPPKQPRKNRGLQRQTRGSIRGLRRSELCAAAVGYFMGPIQCADDRDIARIGNPLRNAMRFRHQRRTGFLHCQCRNCTTCYVEPSVDDRIPPGIISGMSGMRLSRRRPAGSALKPPAAPQSAACVRLATLALRRMRFT